MSSSTTTEGRKDDDSTSNSKANSEPNSTDKADAADVPGSGADKPSEIPAKGWLQIVKRGWKESSDDQVPLLAAGVAFYAFLALFPALIALVSLYGLFADPAVIGQQINGLSGALPNEVRQLITDQLTTLTTQGRSTLGVGLAVSIALALFSASGGVANLITAINLAYDEGEKRNFVKKRGLALILTLGAIVFVALVLGLVAVVPALLNAVLGSGGVAYWLLQIGRWVLLAALITFALAVLYRVAPDRDSPKIRWVSVGALVATVIWLLASLGFSIYVSTFGNYAKTYGVFAGIIVLLFWLWISAYAILLGAEINAESEQQTVRDTTKGEEEPIGERGAVKADSTPGG